MVYLSVIDKAAGHAWSRTFFTVCFFLFTADLAFRIKPPLDVQAP
jgi:hypothetical protein